MPSKAHPEFVTTVAAWSDRHRLLKTGERVLVAVSGGPDSVALLRALHALAPQRDWRVSVAYVHHGVRGVAADREAAFVTALATQCGCPSVIERLTATSSMGLESDEAGLRQARYAVLERIADRAQAQAIAVGHTLDDHVETVLMWLLRGAGVHGLRGIPVARSLGALRVVRPLRSMWRSDVEAWLRSLGQSWCTDETNASRAFVRNRIRHELVPLLAAAYNPQIKEALRHLASTAEALGAYVEAQAQAWLQRQMARSDGEISLPLAALCAEPVALQQAVLRSAMQQLRGTLRQITFRHWEEIAALLAERPVGSLVDLPGGLQVEKTAEQLVMRLELQPSPNRLSNRQC